jgi:hypothetical protein
VENTKEPMQNVKTCVIFSTNDSDYFIKSAKKLTTEVTSLFRTFGDENLLPFVTAKARRGNQEKKKLSRAAQMGSFARSTGVVPSLLS